jgi:hypothetical protein
MAAMPGSGTLVLGKEDSFPPIDSDRKIAQVLVSGQLPLGKFLHYNDSKMATPMVGVRWRFGGLLPMAERG